jgi:short-subunit dehydrogenase
MPSIHWIIGATHGIGRAVAEAALHRGDHVVASGRDEAALAELVGHYPNLCTPLPLDITDSDAITKAVQKLPMPLASVQIYAGTYTPTGVIDWRWDDVLRTINVNFTGLLNVVYHVLPLLRRQKTPVQLVLCGSVAGFVGLPQGQPYSATKAALINFAQSLRAEELAYAKKTKQALVDVRVINPGFVKTRLTAKNEFPMPFVITPEVAAQCIWHQLNKRGRFEVNFPKPMVLVMKSLAALPNCVYFWLAQRIAK